MNPIRYHISWLETMLAQEAAGGRATAIDGEIWAARIGDCAIVGAPGEIFGAIGTAVRRASPAPVTIFAGYSQGSLGYVATPDEYPHGGYEPAISHRGYGQPAPFAPEVAGIIERTALELLRRALRVIDQAHRSAELPDLAAAIAAADRDRLALRDRLAGRQGGPARCATGASRRTSRPPPPTPRWRARRSRVAPRRSSGCSSGSA